ncbi:hypothetical protein D3C85_1212780 [compost metagenome]
MLNTAHVTKKKKTVTKRDTAFDRLVLLVSILYPLSALPQMISIFKGNIDGVSVASWAGFFVCAGIFLVYGLRHKVWPMILSNALWVVVDGLVVVGLISYRI